MARKQSSGRLGRPGYHSPSGSASRVRSAPPPRGETTQDLPVRFRWGIAAGLIIAVYLVYRAATGFQFVYDDFQYILTNPNVRQGVSAESLLWAFISRYASNWHPLSWISHMLDVEFFGLEPAGHHLVSILLHALNAVLLFLVLARLTRAPRLSSLVAALFAVHPLQVESVAWVAERKNLLSTFFLLLVLEAYRRYAEKPAPGRYLTVAALFWLGLMAKPMLVTVPLLLLLLDFWSLDRPGKGVAISRLLLEKAPLLLLSGASSVMTVIAQEEGGSMRSVHQYSLAVRGGNALVSYVAYLVKTIWPKGLCAFYPHPGPSLEGWKPLGAALLLVAVTGLSVWQRRRRPWLAFGWLWYLVALVPVIGLVQVGDQAMADRYAYLPIIGPFIIGVWGTAELVRARPRFAAAARALAAVVLLVLGVATAVQTTYWEDNATLFRRALAVTRDNWYARTSLASSLAMVGDLDGAAAQYRDALAVKPRDPILENNLAFILGRQDKIEEATELFREAAALKPGYAEPVFNIGVLRIKLNDFEGAEAQAALLDGIDPKWAARLREFIRYKRALLSGSTPTAALPVPRNPMDE